MRILVITADLGHFKAYRVTKELSGRPVIELIESYDSLEGHGKLGEKLSDEAGRFIGGGGKGEVAKGYGEPHNLETEIRKRLAKMIALNINAIIKKEDPEKWYLAAVGKINKNIIENLEPAVKAKMDKNITVDLTNTPRDELMGHFA